MYERLYYGYILASRSSSLYTGMTNKLLRRIQEHREGEVPALQVAIAFTALCTSRRHDVRAAIGREKEIKGWRREKKLALIEGTNPTWADLTDDLFAKFLRKTDPSLRSG